MKYRIRIFPPAESSAKTVIYNESNRQRAKQLMKSKLMKKQYGAMGAVYRVHDQQDDQKDERITAFYFKNSEGLKKL